MKIKWIIRALLLLALAFFTFLMVRLTLPYTAMRDDVDFLETKQLIYHIRHWRWCFYIHVFTSCLVLVAGFTQFFRYFLKNYPRVHRVMGWIYLLVVLFISGPAAFVMGWYANGGLPARASFVLLSSLWILTTGYAGYYAIKRKFQLHGEFMFRSYALTLSALTLRSYTILFSFTTIAASPRDIYITTAWLSWVPNLLLAEVLIRRGWVRKVHS